MDFDSLVLHDMHERKCMVIALNYTDTSENDRVHQSNSHSEATLELQVMQEQHLMGVFVASSRTHPYSVGSEDGGSGSGSDFHTATWKYTRKTFSLNASLVGGTVFITRYSTLTRNIV